MIAFADPPRPGDWIKAQPHERWLDGGVYWVSILCTDDDRRGVGLMAGGSQKPLAITRDLDVSDGRDYVVTHYCPAIVHWPEPAQ